MKFVEIEEENASCFDKQWPFQRRVEGWGPGHPGRRWHQSEKVNEPITTKTDKGSPWRNHKCKKRKNLFKEPKFNIKGPKLNINKLQYTQPQMALSFFKFFFATRYFTYHLGLLRYSLSSWSKWSLKELPVSLTKDKKIYDL